MKSAGFDRSICLALRTEFFVFLLLLNLNRVWSRAIPRSRSPVPRSFRLGSCG